MKLPIAEERWLSKYCTLELHNGLAVKTFNKNFPKHVNEEWLKDYNHFRGLWNNTPVEIFEITENQIIMEYIPGATTAIEWVYRQGTTQSRLGKVAACLFRLSADMFDFSENENKLFYHEDLNLTNLMVYEDKITLVDPESWIYGKTINYNALIQPHLNLSKVAHKILEKTISNTKFY